MTEDRVETALRGLARLEGAPPDKVIADYRRGGPLAAAVRSMLGGPVSLKRRGPKPDQNKRWLQFVLVVMAKRSKKEGSFDGDVYEHASRFDLRESGNAVASYRKNFSRCKKSFGWKQSDVPDGPSPLAVMFSGPPSL